MPSFLTETFTKSDDFVVGVDSFSNLRIDPAENIENFYYFYDQKGRRLIKRFVLLQGERTDYLCEVTLIKKGEKFTPRLAFSIRDKRKKIAKLVAGGDVTPSTATKANVNLGECHENFWHLISFLQSLREIDLPLEHFSLVSQDEAAIVSALRGRDPASIKSIIKQLSSSDGIKLTDEDVNQLLKRKEKLEKFERAIEQRVDDESRWQSFFEANKWIFGYGLNYQILRQEASQPHYGGTRVDGKGGQRGDFLTSTSGDMGFTVLVEIKTPATPLLRGTKEIRSGAWSLSQELTDAVAQIEANIDTWDKRGSSLPENMDTLESKSVYTVQPKGIIVIGSLKELDTRNKRETFQRFRKSLHGIEILTFDELYERAKFIVDTRA